MSARSRDPAREMTRFTDRARQAVDLAGHEARKLNHEYIGTEHILLGIISEGSGVGANSLTILGADLPRVRAEVLKLVRAGPEEVAPGRLPMTPRARKVIDHAIEESRCLHHDRVGTEHLLLGLLRERDGVAAQVLMNMGLLIEDVVDTVLRLIGEGVEKDH